MITIFSNYGEQEEKLCSVYEKEKKNNTIVVMEDDGFLPESVISPFSFYVEKQRGECQKGRPLFANSLDVPEFWEIVLDFFKAEIFVDGIKKADVEYALPMDFHNVKAIKWMMGDGYNYKSDFYDKKGNLFFTELYDDDHSVDVRIYYGDNNLPVIICQPFFGRYTLLKDGKVSREYDSEKDFIVDFINNEFDDETEIITNNLNLAGLLSEVNAPQKNLILQGKVEDMSELNNLPADTNIKVLFDSKEELQKWNDNLSIPCERFFYYENEFPENKCEKEILILTNSDQIERLEELIVSLSDFNFNIAAATLMSEKLMSLSKYENVALYPGISQQAANDLLSRSSLYLDINHYSQLYDAVYEAYKNNLLLVGFDVVLHDKDYILPECVFSVENIEEMIAYIKTLYENHELLKETLLKQNQLPNRKGHE